MDCQLDEVFAALRGDAPVDVRMVVAPAALPGPGERVPPPSSGKATYGEDLPFHLDGQNITVQWSDPDVSTERAQAILDAAEAGYQQLIDVDGWPTPVSADHYRLWFILDPTIGGSGYTTLYTSGDYPDGYPVTWLNPDYVPDGSTDYELSVAVHELGHSIQYAVRSWQATAEESWFWEASSEWMADRGAPDLNTYALSSYWYARGADLDYDSIANQHQYGMFLLVTSLAEQEIGPDGVRDLWAGSGSGAWPDVIGAAAGLPFGEVVRGMSGAFAAGSFAESELYYPPVLTTLDAGLVDELDFAPGAYGTIYLTVPAPPAGAEFYVDPGFGLAFAQAGAWSDSPPDGTDFIVAITSPADPPTSVHYGVRMGSADTAGDTAGEPTGGGCACGTETGGGGGLLVLLSVVGLRRRR